MSIASVTREHVTTFVMPETAAGHASAARTADDFTVVARRVAQIVGLVGFLALVAGAGVFGGRLMSTIESLTTAVSTLSVSVRASEQAATADRYELRSLRERIDRMEQRMARTPGGG